VTLADTHSTFAMRFLGTGSAASLALGSASAVFEINSTPSLLIDCGPSTPERFHARYGVLPKAMFITHAHLDHIGGLENYFYRAVFKQQQIKLFVPATLVAMLHLRLGEFPGLAEGGRNFWDAFQLVPVGQQFFHDGLRFDAFPVRHHAPNTAFGLGLVGQFVYSGDTRPIPEIIAHFGAGQESIFHDCTLKANPSHCGVDDLEREYPPETKARMWLYHQHDPGEQNALRARGWRVLDADASIALGIGCKRDSGA
jgi:ribonuclease BN (tRNA processing enzyme)